jgi:hypothetical protein
MKQILYTAAVMLALVSPVSAASSMGSTRVSPDTIQSFVEGKEDAVQHALGFAGIHFPEKSIPGMPTAKFYDRKSLEQRSSYISGAVFAYSHLSARLKRDDLVKCYNSFYGPGHIMLDYALQQDPSIGSRNIISVLLNFCLSTNELDYLISRAVK